uniref:Uncharacterized protein n=1 Tax=Anguilla anguilla TaxID=7936 RepID=A0A0E9VQR4_ANGAN
MKRMRLRALAEVSSP